MAETTPLVPKALKPGDKVAIVSPAGIINPDYVEGAIPALRSMGWEPVVMPHTLGRSGSYSGTRQERLHDIAMALDEPRVRAIMCSRGGYGAVHLLNDFPIEAMRRDPRWLIGFSDISALHAMMTANGIVSLHAPMCKHLATLGADDTCTRMMFDTLSGNGLYHSVTTDSRSLAGNATGRLVGGNLAVVQALMSTPYDIMNGHGDILLIEDIAEPIYKIERILYQLRLSGTLNRMSGLILGQFTEYQPDRNHNDVYEAIMPLVADLDIPVAVNFPVGHTDYNLPMAMGATTSLKITPDATQIAFDI